MFARITQFEIDTVRISLEEALARFKEKVSGQLSDAAAQPDVSPQRVQQFVRRLPELQRAEPLTKFFDQLLQPNAKISQRLPPRSFQQFIDLDSGDGFFHAKPRLAPSAAEVAEHG